MARSQITGKQPEDESAEMAERMISYLVDLSLQKGRPVTWLDYKNDPNIDMVLLKEKIGKPVSIEQRVRIGYAKATSKPMELAAIDTPQVGISRVPAGYQKAGDKPKAKPKAEPKVQPKIKSEQTSVVKKTVAAQPKQEPKAKAEIKPIPKPRLVPEPVSEPRSMLQTNGKKLTTFGIPKTGCIAQPGNSVVIVKINSENGEELIEPKDIRVISGPDWFNPAIASKILPGLSENHEIAEVTIYENTTSVQIEVYESSESTTPTEKVEATMVLASKAVTGASGGRFMVALYLIDLDEECQDYIFFRRENNLKGGRNVIEQDERHHIPKA